MLGQILLLPKKIMKMINGLCRVFLWTGNILTSIKALAAWDKIFLPKAVGGINVMNLGFRNAASITKQLWALAEKRTVYG